MLFGWIVLVTIWVFLLKKVVRDKIQESTLTTIAHSELESSMCNYNTAKWAQPNGRGNIEH